MDNLETAAPTIPPTTDLETAGLGATADLAAAGPVDSVADPGPRNESQSSQDCFRSGAHRGDDRHRRVLGAGGGAGVLNESGDPARDEGEQRAAAALAGPFRR